MKKDNSNVPNHGKTKKSAGVRRRVNKGARRNTKAALKKEYS